MYQNNERRKQFYPEILFCHQAEYNRLFADVNDVLLWLCLRGAYALEREFRYRSGCADKSIKKSIELDNECKKKDIKKENNIFGPEPLTEFKPRKRWWNIF